MKFQWRCIKMNLKSYQKIFEMFCIFLLTLANFSTSIPQHHAASKKISGPRSNNSTKTISTSREETERLTRIEFQDTELMLNKKLNEHEKLKNSIAESRTTSKGQSFFTSYEEVSAKDSTLFNLKSFRNETKKESGSIKVCINIKKLDLQ